MLGRRDPEIYGTFTLAELETRISDWAGELGLRTTFFQTNHEGEFCEYLHKLPDLADAAIVNAGAWTHYSWAIRDALEVAAHAGRRGPHLRRREPRGLAPRTRSSRASSLEKISGEGAEGYRARSRSLKRELGA